MSLELSLDPLAIQVFDAISEFGGKVYIVGGSVRDLLMGKTVSHDIDVEVFHLSYNQLCNLLKRFGHVNTFGKQFAIVQLKELKDYDFALPRKERKSGTKHQDFEIMIDENLPLEKAIARRDLTMNALLYDYKTKEIIDLCHGIDDINNRIIRVVQPETFVEDPLRVLRIAQFAARFSMDVDEKSYELCKKMVKDGMLEELSVQRVYQEYSKILMSDHPSIGFRFLEKIGALPSYLEALRHIDQRRDYHPEGNVFNHTMMAIDEASKVKASTSDPLSFMWACLFHDIGKPLTTDEQLHSPNHALVGAKMVNDIDLMFIKKQKRYVETLVKHHMQLTYLDKVDDVKYLLLLKELENVVPIADLFMITYCDKLGRGKPQNLDDLKAYQDRMYQKYQDHSIPAIIKGKDLKFLNIKPEEYPRYLDLAYLRQLQGKNKVEILDEIKSKLK